MERGLCAKKKETNKFIFILSKSIENIYLKLLHLKRKYKSIYFRHPM